MRIDELVLERYGAFEHRRLTLDGPGLTVVYGPNEAGKSTCLAALSDFFFRIPEGTPRIARFGSDLARIGAALRTADGRAIRLKRRYGRVRTLIDDAGSPCDDAILTALLGPTTRERFDTLFGLSHEALRRGGETLLRADGDIGRLIVEAGGGLRALMGRLDAIEAEIDGLFATRKKKDQAFYKALTAFEAADKVSKSARLTHDAYERDRKARDAAATALGHAKSGVRDLTASLSRLERTARVVPTLRELDGIDARLAPYADVTDLPATFPDRCTKAFADRDAAATACAAARVRFSALAERRKAMIVDEGLAAVEAEVRDIGERVTLVSRARADRANRTREMGDAEATLATLRQRLRLDPTATLEPMMPPPDVLNAVRALAGETAVRQPKIEAAREAIDALEEAVQTAERGLATRADAGRDEPFGLDAMALATLPAEWAGAEQRCAEAARIGEAARARAATLGFEDVARLRALVWPPEDQIRTELDARNAMVAERTRQAAARAAAETQRAMARAEKDRLRQGGEIATAEVVAMARRHRDEVWQPLRAAHLAGRSERSAIDRAADVAAVEAGIAAADRLSDGRVNEAQRVASLIEAERRAVEADAALTALEEAEQRLDDLLDQRTAAFRQAFPDACHLHPDLPAMLTFAAGRIDALGRQEAAEATRGEAESAVARLAPRRRRLDLAEGRAGLSPAPGADLAARVEALGRAIAAHDRAFADHQREEHALAALRPKLAAARRNLAGLERDEAAWGARWAQATAALGGPSDQPPTMAADLADRWRDAASGLSVIALTQRRLSRMDEDEADLARRIAATAGRLNLALPPDPVVAGTMLVDRWRANDAVHQRKEALGPDLDGAAAALDAHARSLAEAQDGLATLAAEAALPPDEAAMAATAARHREWAALRADQTRLAAAARGAGDGLDLAVLRAEAGDQDLDAVRAEIADLRGRLDVLGAEVEAAIRAEQQAAAALAAHEGGSEATRAVVDREAATTEMHAAIERYVELTLARSLVTRAIQRVRNEQQDPLVRAAGVMFAQMTRGEFDGVAADTDGKGAPVVVGVRAGGRGPQGVATMSEGTRDQLFLAFRLASLANYCAAAEPLPFVADDILVHFDDERGAATLDLLSDFAGATQVLLFTHHRSVLAAAERLAAEGRATIAGLN